VDADRADFLLRDGRALGLDFSHYDVDRLAPHVVLAEDDTLGFITAVDERTLSPLESFFLARARTYQVLVRHHKVAQVAAALRFASAEALARDACRKPREYLTMIGAGDIRKTGRGQEVVEAFALVDDGWWIQILRDLPAAPGSPLAAALGLVLRRERGITSVWKRRGDLTDSQLVEVNTLAGIARNDVDLRFERQRRELAARGIFVLAHRFRPYAKIIRGPDQGQSLVYVRTRLGLRPASRLSPIFKSLTEIWENEVHLQAFSVEELGIDATLAELRIE
jgi:HD superfamily phosphohydrolase